MLAVGCGPPFELVYVWMDDRASQLPIENCTHTRTHTNGKRQMNKIIYLTMQSGCFLLEWRPLTMGKKTTQTFLANKIIFRSKFISEFGDVERRHRRKEHRNHIQDGNSQPTTNLNVPKMDGTRVHCSSVQVVLCVCWWADVLYLYRWRHWRVGWYTCIHAVVTKTMPNKVRQFVSYSICVYFGCLGRHRESTQPNDVFSETQSFARSNAHLHSIGLGVLTHSVGRLVSMLRVTHKICVRSCIITRNGYN